MSDGKERQGRGCRPDGEKREEERDGNERGTRCGEE